jgi:hypothetical protein
MAGDYLEQAAEALRASGSPETLYRDALGKRERWTHALARILAFGNRVEYSRTSILFSAIAAEAYVNHFLAAEFSRKDADGLDRLRTVDKFLFAPQLAVGKTPFRRDRQPLQRIAELFELRNELMHPKSSVRTASRHHALNLAEFERFNPVAASRFLVAVAEAALELTTLRTVDDADSTALMIWSGKALVLRYGRDAREKTPPIDGRPVESFAVQTVRRYTDKKTGRPVIELTPDPKSTVAKLRRQK